MRTWPFLLTVGIASAFFAESLEGNFTPVTFTVWGWLVLVPLYGLHALVLGRLAFSNSRPSFSTLYFCGVLFGLYEAYIMKIVWTGWPPDPLKVGGVSVVAALTVVLWWHPFMAFMVPLAFVDRYGIGGSGGRFILGDRIVRALDSPKGPFWMACAGLYAGLYHTTVGQEKPWALPAGLLDVIVLTAAMRWLRRFGDARLDEQLPSGKLWIGCLVALALVYVVLGCTMNRDSLPGLGPQATVWALYALATAALLTAKGRDRTAGPEVDLPTRSPASLRREWLPLVATWLAVGTLQYLAPQAKVPIFMGVTLVGVSIGLAALGSSLVHLRRPSATT